MNRLIGVHKELNKEYFSNQTKFEGYIIKYQSNRHYKCLEDQLKEDFEANTVDLINQIKNRNSSVIEKFEKKYEKNIKKYTDDIAKKRKSIKENEKFILEAEKVVNILKAREMLFHLHQKYIESMKQS